MLPSKGYFSNVICPDNPKCIRPCCFFHHQKSANILFDDGELGDEMKELVHMTAQKFITSERLKGNKTDKAADMEIMSTVINEIEDSRLLVGNVEKQTTFHYNPTPISTLKKRHIPVALAPTRPTYSTVLRKKVEAPVRHKRTECNPVKDKWENISWSKPDATNYIGTPVQKAVQYTQEYHNETVRTTYEHNIQRRGVCRLANGEKHDSSNHTNTYVREAACLEEQETCPTPAITDKTEHFVDVATNEIDLTNTSSDEDSPPIKKKKDEINDNLSRPSPPVELIEDRWIRAIESITTKKVGLRVAPVTNVQMMLDEKDRILTGEILQTKQILNKQYYTSTHKVGNSKEKAKEKNMTKKIVRKAHKIPTKYLQYPNPLTEENLKIPYSVRYGSLTRIFDELIKFVDEAVAKRSAQDMELDICRKVSMAKTYKSAVGMAILRIRKNKGCMSVGEVKQEGFQSESIPSFTNGWTIYKCFSEYLVTEEQYKDNGFPIRITSKEGCAYIEKSARRTKKSNVAGLERLCDHCSQQYTVDESGFPLRKNDCYYHWGKLKKLKHRGSVMERFTCCDGDIHTDPCTNGEYHVSNTWNEDCLEGFVRTRTPDGEKPVDTAGIYGIDCEMCYTTRGIELTRCTLVDLNGVNVYDRIVVPDNPIIDYCTRFSGMTEEMISESSYRLTDVQDNLLEIVNEKTILVGHSLDSDMKALKLFHNTFVDTSIVFPHSNGLPYKNSLKRLAKDILNLSVQESERGHDSYEDANACILLMMKKISDDAKKRKPRVIISLNT